MPEYLILPLIKTFAAASIIFMIGGLIWLWLSDREDDKDD